MKSRFVITAAALALAMGAAQAYEGGTRTTMLPSNGAIHTGATTYEDWILIDQIVAALQADRQLEKPGVTATITANNGKVALSGSADGHAQATRAEKIVKSVAGSRNVAGTLSTEGG
jgi:osmotically-inducible protein OsmY